MSFARAGSALTVLAVALLVFAIAGVAPWVAGSDADCSEDGPHGAFLIAWPVAALLGLVAIGLLHDDRQTARIAFATAIVVPVVAAAFWVLVVVDGVRECGF